jgi:hypothetical protein
MPRFSIRLLDGGAGLLLLAATSCAQLPPTAAVAVPPIPAGEARVWFYRDGGPYDAQTTPYVRMNDAIVGLSEPNGAFYRDVLPGQYHVTVDSYGMDFNQSREVYLAAGQQAYFKIVALQHWIMGSSGRNDFERDTFYVWQFGPEVAQADIARRPFYGGS